MTIIEFYTELSQLLEKYRCNSSKKNNTALHDLVEQAKTSGLLFNVNLEKLMRDTIYHEKFDDLNSYDEYSEETNDGDEDENSSYDDSSYDEDEDGSGDGDEDGDDDTTPNVF